MRTHVRTLAAAAALGLLLAGCTSDPAPIASGTPEPSASAPASPSTSPSSTLTAAQQQAVEEAAAVVLAYEQMFYDLLGDSTRPLNDINGFVTDPQLERDLLSLQRLSSKVAQGRLVYESTGPIEIVSVDPVKVRLEADPPFIDLEVCVDKTSISGTEDGQARTGRSESSLYRVARTTYLPAPGWAVSKVLPPEGHDQPQPC